MGKCTRITGVVVVLMALMLVSAGGEEVKKKTVPENGLHEMEIKGMGFDQAVGSPVVVLSDKEGGELLPIWIGLCEARSLEIGVSGVVAPRPLTYDLFAAILRTLDAQVEQVVIVDLRDSVYYAEVRISSGNKKSKIDARPSDALALAARLGVPIYVDQSVIDKASLKNEKGDKRGI